MCYFVLLWRCKALQQNCIVVATGTLTPAFPVLCFRQGGLSFTGMGHKSLPHQFTSGIRLTAGLGQTHHPWEKENTAGLYMSFWCWFYRFAFHSLTIFSFYVYVFFLFFPHTNSNTFVFTRFFFLFFFCQHLIWMFCKAFEPR